MFRDPEFVAMYALVLLAFGLAITDDQIQRGQLGLRLRYLWRRLRNR